MKTKKNKKTRVSLQLEVNELEILKKRAKKQNTTVSAVIRDTLFGPKDTKVDVDLTASRLVEDAAFDVLDGKTPKHPDIKKEPLAKERNLGSPNHPCIYLQKKYLSGYKPGECEGVCGKRGQNNKVCFWTSMVATNCPYFISKPAK